MSSDIVRAAELLYAVEARDLAWTMMADLGDKSTDVGVLAVMSELTAKYRDARGMLLLGKLALARGYPLEHAAFPTIGVPDYTPIGPPVDPALVYSIVRQESWFNPKTVSSANALGLMQVTPAAGKYIAGKFKATFDQKRLLSDMPYNVQFGSAELGDVIKDYRGSYIMAFAAYNAGRGRVKEWLAKYGDPRDPKVDPIDWVERIPFSETRNYVQRVMENVQVYRLRFGGSSTPADRGGSAPRQRGQLIRRRSLPYQWRAIDRDGLGWHFSCKMTASDRQQGRKVHGGQRHRRRRGEQRFRHRPRWP